MRAGVMFLLWTPLGQPSHRLYCRQAQDLRILRGGTNITLPLRIDAHGRRRGWLSRILVGLCAAADSVKGLCGPDRR